MIKKALFILTSILVGFMVITNGYYLCFYNVFQKFTEETVANKEYEEAGKYYSYSFDYNDLYYNQEQEDGTYIEVYPALNMYARTAKNEDNKEVNYDTMESGVQFSFFHLSSDFATVDKDLKAETPVRGGVELVFGDKTAFFPFAMSETDTYYMYIAYYGYFPFTIYHADYVSELGKIGVSVDTVPTNIKVYDGDGEVEYEIKVTKALFNNEFHKSYFEAITAYNKEKENDAIKGTTSENYEDLVKAINDITTNKQYSVQHSVDIIFKSSKFGWSFGLTLGAFFALDFLIGFLLFRKKKTPKFTPRRPMVTPQQNTPKLNYEPQQFSRRDFLEAEEVVEETKEEVVEESTEVTE